YYCLRAGAAAIAMVCLLSSSVLADAVETPKISSFAPAEDLIAQVDFFLGRVGESVATPADFDEAHQARTLKDGNTLAAIALLLALHDEKHALKDSAGALLAAAQELSGASDNYERARAALEKLRSARDGSLRGGAPVKWEKVAALAPL